eukprot:XP_011665244.1 PREDICTED: uncharacterized protein LOC105438745 [Strongylocentrotus purpuratus]
MGLEINYTKTKCLVVVPFDKLTSGARICKPFELDFTDQPDIVAVSLRIGQNERLEEELLFPLDFSTPNRRKRTSPQDPGRQEDFDEKLKAVANRVVKYEDIDDLGKALGCTPEDVQRYVDTNMKSAHISIMGTLSLLRDWRKKQTEATECEALKDALEKAGQIHLANELFDDLVEASPVTQALKEGTDTQNTDDGEKKEEEEEEEDEYFMAMESLLNETDMTTLTIS